LNAIADVVPPMPGAERRFRPFTEFVHASGWDTEFVQLDWTGPQPNFDSRAVFEQVNAQTAGKVVMGSLSVPCPLLASRCTPPGI
jgi:hypothetical protein